MYRPRIICNDDDDYDQSKKKIYIETKKENVFLSNVSRF